MSLNMNGGITLNMILNKMKLYCHRCQIEQEIIVTPSGPHLKASCCGCKRYIKFLNKEEVKQVEKEEDAKVTRLSGAGH